MTLETSTQIMDDVFASKIEESRSRLLKIVQEFLISEDQKYLLQEKSNPFDLITKCSTEVRARYHSNTDWS